MPISDSRSATYSELVSVRVDPSISEPTAMTSAVRTSVNPRGKQPDHDPQAQVRVHAGSEIVSHDAEAAVKLLEAVGRKRLDHVEHAEQHEAGHRAAHTDRNEPESDEHAEDLVDHDRAGIYRTEISLRDCRRPRADRERHHDEPDLDDRRTRPPD